MNMPSLSEQARRQYARAWAHKLQPQMGEIAHLGDYEQEMWLCQQFDEILTTYEKGLEQMLDHVQKIANDAISMARPSSILIPKGEYRG
jgi:hypothetical protein